MFKPDSWATIEVGGLVADTTLCLHLDASKGSFPTTEEKALVADLRAGREAAYEGLIEHYQQPVYNLVCRLLNNPADASDIVQEVFLKIFRNIDSFRGNSSLKTWIYRIAVNEAHNQRRWFSRHHQKEIGLERDERSFEATVADRGRSPFDLALDSETRSLVEEALAKLNPNFRAVVVLRDIEDLSYEEISLVLELSLGTVKSRILRGREALRKILEGQLVQDASVRWTPQPAE